jgi:hypothetical protein
LVLDGVPGFFRKDSEAGPRWTIAGSPGLLIPCRATDGRIRALRIRPDDPRGAGKYRWFSSTERPGGVGSGVHSHVARPTSAAAEPGTAWITEGEFKADLAADWLHALVVSIPGVSSWSLALPDIVELLPDGGRVVVALDSDWRVKPPVLEAAWCLAVSCEVLGYGVEVATWDVNHKGLDDALAAGVVVERKPPTVLIEPTWPLRLRSRVLAVAPSRKEPTAIPLETMRRKLDETFAQLGRCT